MHMYYDTIFMITYLHGYLLLPQILVIPSFKVVDFSPLITFLICFLSFKLKNKFSIQKPTLSFRMLEPLIPPDEQPVPELMTQLAAMGGSYTAKSTCKGGTEGTVNEFPNCF